MQHLQFGVLNLFPHVQLHRIEIVEHMLEPQNAQAAKQSE